MHEPISCAEPIYSWRRSANQLAIAAMHNRWLVQAFPSVLSFWIAEKIIRKVKLETLLLPFQIKQKKLDI